MWLYSDIINENDDQTEAQRYEEEKRREKTWPRDLTRRLKDWPEWAMQEYVRWAETVKLDSLWKEDERAKWLNSLWQYEDRTIYSNRKWCGVNIWIWICNGMKTDIWLYAASNSKRQKRSMKTCGETDKQMTVCEAVKPVWNEQCMKWNDRQCGMNDRKRRRILMVKYESRQTEDEITSNMWKNMNEMWRRKWQKTTWQKEEMRKKEGGRLEKPAILCEENSMNEKRKTYEDKQMWRPGRRKWNIMKTMIIIYYSDEDKPCNIKTWRKTMVWAKTWQYEPRKMKR